MIFSIIDVGTHSAHLLIGQVSRRGSWRTLSASHDVIRLGDEGLRRGRLTRAAMARAMTVLRRYAARLAQDHVTQIDAVATSAVREAANGAAFVRRVRARTKIPLRIISGEEEARLIALGVRRLNHLRGPSLIVSIGGGSAQVSAHDGQRLRCAWSLPLGADRLAQRFIRHDPPQPQELAALRSVLARQWGRAARRLGRARQYQALGSSAMIEQLARAASIRPHRGRVFRRDSITQRALCARIAWLSTSTAAQRRTLTGVDPDRRALLLPAAVTLLTWMERCGVSTLRVVPGSLRDGLMDTFCYATFIGNTSVRVIGNRSCGASRRQSKNVIRNLPE